MKVGDKVKRSTITYGEDVLDRKGNFVHIPPLKSTYIGVIEYIGPECPFPSCEVVRCSGGNVALKLNSGFSFYTKDIGTKESVEVIK